LDKNSPQAKEIMKELQEKEYQGYQFEGRMLPLNCS